MGGIATFVPIAVFVVVPVLVWVLYILTRAINQTRTANRYQQKLRDSVNSSPNSSSSGGSPPPERTVSAPAAEEKSKNNLQVMDVTRLPVKTHYGQQHGVVSEKYKTTPHYTTYTASPEEEAPKAYVHGAFVWDEEAGLHRENSLRSHKNSETTVRSHEYSIPVVYRL